MPFSRLAKSTFHFPVHLRGLALPNFQVYYWAAVLVTAYWWFEGSHSNAAVCVDMAYLGSLLDLQNLVYRGAGAYADVPAPTKTTLQVLVAARWWFMVEGHWSPVQPLWGNPRLAHLRLVPAPQVWARYGVRTLWDIIPEGSLLTFAQLAWLFLPPVRLDVFSMCTVKTCCQGSISRSASPSAGSG